MKRYFALSRSVHGVLDIAAAAFCALLWLGRFPAWPTVALSLATALAAYTAIYSLNDLVGLANDREKFAGQGRNPGYAMDAAAERHPVAQGTLGVKAALAWMCAWFTLALAGCYLLNPVIVLVLLFAAAMEIIYCRLLKVTHLRTILGGLVKCCGPISAVLVVDRAPDAGRLLLLFCWVFFWEIGGQNIPSDWNDTAEDRRVHARTIPIRFGFQKAGLIVVAALGISVLLSGFLPLLSPSRLGAIYILVSLLLGYVLLLRPAVRLYRIHDGGLAARLFESASFYPLSQLALITAFLAAGSPIP